MRHLDSRAFAFLIAAVLFCLSASIRAQTLPQEYNTLIRSQGNVGPLDATLLGDRIDYYTGHVEFAATDVNLPGNNALPVAIGRRYTVEANPAGVIPERAFGDWDIEVPHIEGVVATSVGWTVPGANPNARCSAFAGAPAAVVTTPSIAHVGATVTTSIPWEQYSTGYQLAVPGYGRRELLQRAPGNTEKPTSGTYPIVTNDWWMVSCLGSLDVDSPGTGEGFLAIAPDGTKVTLNWLATRDYVDLSRPADTAEPNVTATLPRADAWMMATKVEDRFGNWVKYQYDPNKPLHLKQISSSDGRTITLTYTGTTNIVQSISDGSHTWTYAYTYNGSYYSLTSVTLPDASKWQIGFDTLNHISWSYTDPWTCGSPGTPSNPNSFTGTLTHPSGAHGTFTFNIARRGRNGAPNTCYTNSANVAFGSVQPNVYDTLALVQKQISGPGLAAALTWSLAYAGCSANSCASSVTTTVADPRGFNTRYTFGTGYNDDEGLLTKKESGGSGASYLQTETYQYFPATGQSYPASLGTSTQSRGDTVRLAELRPLKQRSTALQGATFTYTASSLDEFGFAQSLTRAGSATKSESLTYTNDKTHWVLGTVKTVVSAGATELDRVLNALDQPTSVSRFGQVDQTFGYNADGTLAWSKDGAGHQTSFSNWTRGLPKNIGYATGENASVTVSNTGTIDSWTDERGSVTSYDHDTMGRLSGIHTPAGDPGTGGNQTFAATTIAWSTSASGWASTETTDTYQKITKYDALLRPTLVNENNARYVNTAYTGDGGPSFVSIPSTLPNEGSGTTFQYDGLGRVTSRNFVGYITSTAYQSGFVTRVSDPNATTYVHYLTHDEPTMAWPVTIDGPLYTTNIARDAWGRPESASRGSVTREWTWGGRFVCATFSPERGTTVLERDGAGNVTASADLTGNVGCDYGAVNASNKVARSYDNRNRLLTVNYPGGTDFNIAQTWWPNGQLHTANRGGIQRTMNYNRRGLLTFETIAVDGTPYEIDTAYNTRGQLATLTYPDASSVDYAPNAWGEPTKVGTFASAITYWPNSAVKAFTYGNGLAHAMTENTRLLPQTVTEGAVLNRDLGYDGVGNVTSITDHLAGNTDSVAMTYDTANRLLTANAAGLWGNASFGYDDFDNLKTSTVGGVATSFTIDAATNRATAMVTGGVSTPLSYDSQGHLIKKGAQSYTFDRSDLLLGLPGLESYRYGADGRRTVIDSNGQSRTQIYDHEGRLLLELEPALATGCNPANDRVFCSSFEKPPANLAQTRYVYLGRHLIGKDGAPGLRYLHTDALGSLVAETDASQTVTQRYHYLPYGAAFGTMPDGPGYAGNVMDPSGLVYMQARYYDPQLGRFFSTDPVDPDPMTGTNFNRYAYANGNPYRYYDPSGRYFCEGSDTDCSAVADAVDSLSDAASNSSLSIDQEDSLNAVSDFYGAPDEENGVTLKIGDEGSVPNSLGGTSTNDGETTIGIRIDKIADGAGGRESQKFQDRLAGIVAHEGEHGVDQRVNGMPLDRVTEKAGEIRASTVQAALFQGLNSNYGVWLWTPEGGLQPSGIERSAESSTILWCQSPGANCK